MLSLPLLILPLVNFLATFRCSATKSCSLWLSIFLFLHTLFLFHIGDWSQTIEFQYKIYWENKLIGGLDSINLLMILLINIIIPIVLLNSKGSIRERQLILLIQIFSICVFLVLDLLLFYIAFEILLIPMYYYIGFDGSRNKKIEAQNYLIGYTLFGSLFLLIGGIIPLYFIFGSTDYEILLSSSSQLSFEFQCFLWFNFFLALAIKMPMIPFHIWLPQAHTEAPTGGSIILAAILLKLGSYGFIRYVIPLFPDANSYLAPFIITLALIGTLYSCISALSLLDLKQIIAYSSIAHMNISVIGLFMNDYNGLLGSYLYSISHGFISSGLFLLIGILYERYHTRILKYYRGLNLFMPIYILFLFIFILFNISFPGTFGFIAEILIFISSFQSSFFLSLLMTLVSILLPLYLIWTFQKISYGQISNHLIRFADLNIKEFHLLFPLFFLVLYFGLIPDYLINALKLPILALLN